MKKIFFKNRKVLIILVILIIGIIIIGFYFKTMKTQNISKQEALKIAISYSIKDGAGKADLDDMEKKIEDKGTYYYIAIFPKSNRQNFDISMGVDKKTGAVSDFMTGTLEPYKEPKPAY